MIFCRKVIIFKNYSVNLGDGSIHIYLLNIFEINLRKCILFRFVKKYASVTATLLTNNKFQVESYNLSVLVR